jgi:hypothetical protein
LALSTSLSSTPFAIQRFIANQGIQILASYWIKHRNDAGQDVDHRHSSRLAIREKAISVVWILVKHCMPDTTIQDEKLIKILLGNRLIIREWFLKFVMKGHFRKESQQIMVLATTSVALSVIQHFAK